MLMLALKAKLLRRKTEGFVFLAGFSMMAIELLAAKVASPYIGSSLYTWTSIIGVILLGVTIGAWIGGRLADRYRPQTVMGLAFLFSGVTAVVAYASTVVIGNLVVNTDWPLWWFSLVFCLFVFLPPAICLSAIQPASVKAHLSSLESSATVYGTLGAWNAAGSILGVYVTGFFFEGYLSVRLVWFVISALLIVSGLSLYVRDRLSR